MCCDPDHTICSNCEYGIKNATFEGENICIAPDENFDDLGICLNYKPKKGKK